MRLPRDLDKRERQRLIFALRMRDCGFDSAQRSFVVIFGREKEEEEKKTVLLEGRSRAPLPFLLFLRAFLLRAFLGGAPLGGGLE